MNDFALLRAAISYARKSGWHHDTTQFDALPLEHRWMREGDVVSVWAARVDVNDSMFLPATVQQAVDVFVAFRLLPERFSSAYAAGQAAAVAALDSPDPSRALRFDQCPEHLDLDDDVTRLLCVRDIRHPGPHWNRGREREWGEAS